MGAVLKMSAYGGKRSGKTLRADVGKPQAWIFPVGQCQSGCDSGMIQAGRGDLACNKIRGPVRADALGAPQAKWRIECRKPLVSSWLWPWCPQSPLAPRRKSRHPLRSLSKSLTPASSKNSARACLPRHGGPAPSADRAPWALIAPSPDNSTDLRSGPCALRALWPMRPFDCHDRRQVTC